MKTGGGMDAAVDNFMPVLRRVGVAGLCEAPAEGGIPATQCGVGGILAPS
jgi:hypothetical protein